MLRGHAYGGLLLSRREMGVSFVLDGDASLEEMERLRDDKARLQSLLDESATRQRF